MERTSHGQVSLVAPYNGRFATLRLGTESGLWIAATAPSALYYVGGSFDDRI